MTSNDQSPDASPVDGLADRPPTPEEAALAEKARLGVDLEKVAEHEREMLERGANVKGEGEIEPS